jgi:arylsulfatase A-like enzyme
MGATRARRLAASVLALGPLGALAGCGAAGVEAGAASPPRPGILIVVVDAMRADRLGCYGYGRATTPAIDELALDPDAVVYRGHHVQGAYTKPSVASLFAGVYAFQHGVLWGHAMREDPARPGLLPTQELRPGFDTMAERFDRLGYRTFAVVKSHHLVPRYGFAQGFDEYVGASLKGDDRRVDETLRLAQQGPGPWLGYVHLDGAHHPFPPAHRDPAFMDRYREEACQGYDEAAHAAEGADFTTAEIRFAIYEGRMGLDPQEVAFLGLVYDAKLRRADEHVGRLLRGLKDSGRYDETLIIVTADHGEELYDHGGYAHGHALWQEIIRVPMVVKFPRGGRPGSLGPEVTDLTQAIDLLPSLLSYAGETPGPELPGADVFTGSPRGFAFCETSDEWALVQGGLKLIDGGAKPLLFDMAADPAERADLASSRPREVERLRQAAQALHEVVAIRPGAAPLVESQLSPEAIEALRSLGYVR